MSEAVEAPVPTKMAFVVRTDLRMGKGKIAAQVAHAAIGAYRAAEAANSEFLQSWLENSAVKVVVKGSSEAELEVLEKQALARDLTVFRMVDEGRTQVDADTFTVLAIGPAPIADVDLVVGYLKLM